MITENPKFLKILIIAVFAVVIPVSIVGINFFEKTDALVCNVFVQKPPDGF